MMTSDQITVGCDPEFFIQKHEVIKKKSESAAKLYGSRVAQMLNKDIVEDVIPACGVVGGTKKAPLQIKGLDKGFTIQEDGIAVEFNIPPQTNSGKFSLAVSMALREIEKDLARKGFGRSYVKAVDLKQDWTTKWPDLLQIGCDPDYDAYSEVRAPRTLDMNKIGVTRGTGGHLHLGYPTALAPAHIIAKFLDCVVALPTLEDDLQGPRRRWWGMAGLHRPKPYGVEYRTLSNFWIWSGNLSSNVAAHAIAMVKGLQRSMVQWQAFFNAMNWDKINNIIATEDVKGAMTMFSRFSEFKCYSDVLKEAQDMMYAKSASSELIQEAEANG